MEFTRKKKRGQHNKVRRTWVTKDGYRIIWFRESFGVDVPPCFQATVRTIIPGPGQRNNIDGTEQGALTWELWDFVNFHRRLFKAMKAAKAECERHRKLWEQACEASGARELKELLGKIPNGMPVWATKKANRKIYGLCMDGRPIKYREDDECNDPSDQSETSENSLTSFTGLDEPNTGPAVPVTGEEESTVSQTKTATPVEAPAEERKPRSKKSTAKSSKRTAKRKTSTKGSSSSGNKHSKSSPRKKSKPSKS